MMKTKNSFISSYTTVIARSSVRGDVAIFYETEIASPSARNDKSIVEITKHHSEFNEKIRSLYECDERGAYQLMEYLSVILRRFLPKDLILRPSRPQNDNGMA